MASMGVDWPEIGDLVVGSVVKITPHGAYVSLDEYDIDEGFLHISEISSRWVKNIRAHVREGQKVVLKVLRVNADVGHVDLSLRRVTERGRREKLLAWKRLRKSETFLKMAAEKAGVTSKEATNARSKIENLYGDLYDGFEEALFQGKEAFLKANVPENLASALTEIAKAKIKVPHVKVRGTLNLSSIKPNGVDLLRDAFKLAKEVKKPKDVDVKIYVFGAPKYRIEVTARNYKDAEKTLESTTNAILNSVVTSGGEGSFKRLR